MKQGILNSHSKKAFALALFTWAMLTVIANLTRPIMPIDETRYMTVAWEMFSHKQFILPTLNYEPYSHKPPLLFWLISLSWAVFGVSREAALVVPFLLSSSVLLLTYNLARIIFPERKDVAYLTIPIVLGCSPFVVYGTMVMFDFLLTNFTLMGLYCIFRAAKTNRHKYYFLWGITIGFGILAKGPVVLLYALPPALGYPLWRDKKWSKIKLKHWYGKIFAGVLLGCAIGAAWAYAAILKGGPEYAHMILWGQAAGRVVDAFDHARPWWFYFTLLPLFLFPWIFWPTVFKGFKKGFTTFFKGKSQPQQMFLMLSFVPAFILLCFISGKQPHYLVPLVPAVTILIAMNLERHKANVKNMFVKIPLIVLLLICCLILALVTLEDISWLTDKSAVLRWIGMTPIWPVLITTLLVAVVLWNIKQDLKSQAWSLAVVMIVVIGMVHFQAQRHIFYRYNLEPLAKVVAKHKEQPIAFVRKYIGEIGYMARFSKSVDVIEQEEINAWLAQHKNGLVVMRSKSVYHLRNKSLKFLYTQDFRGSGYYAVITRK